MACKREYYIAHPHDNSLQFEKEMNNILGRDDVHMLDQYLRVFCDDFHYPAFLDMCLDRGSVDCARFVIEGNLPHGHPNLSFDHLQPPPFTPVLFHVIHLICEPDVFHDLLYGCKAVSQVNVPWEGLLPLHWLLDLLMESPPFSDWSPGQSLSTIIKSLFLPKIRPVLECACMLAEHTHSLDQIALGYIHNGEIISLAALLLITRFTKGDFETFKSYTSSIASQAIRDQSVTLSTYCAAAALLSIFEKHGNKFTSLFNEIPGRLKVRYSGEDKAAGVVAEFVTDILHSGIQGLSIDAILTDAYSDSSNPEMVKSTFERLGIKIDDTTTHISRKSPFPSVKIVKVQGRPEVPMLDIATVKWAESVAAYLGNYDDEGVDGATQL